VTTLTLDAAALRLAVAAAYRAVPRRTVLPSCSWLRLDATAGRTEEQALGDAPGGGSLTLTANDAECVALEIRIAADCAEAFSAAVDGKMLADLCKRLPKRGPVVLTYIAATDGKSGQLTIAGTTLRSYDPDDCPPVPRSDSQDSWTLAGGALADALRRVLPCVATDASRPVLTGVHIEQRRDGALWLAAADGFQLAVAAVAVAAAPEAGAAAHPIIVPGAAVRLLVALLTGPGPVTIAVNASGTVATFRHGDVVLTTNLLQGTFPNYQQLIPAEHKATVTVDRVALLEAVKSASIVVRDGSGIVRLYDSGNFLTISARSGVEYEYESAIPAEIEGDARIALNAAYIAMALMAFAPAKRVTLALGTPSSPALWTSAELPDYQQVTMPMFVEWGDK